MTESYPPIDELDEVSFRSYAMFVQSKLMSSIFNLNKLLEISIDAFVELMRVDMGFIMLFDEKAQQLSVEAVKGLKSHTIRKTRINVDKDIIQGIIERKAAIFLLEFDEALPVKILFQEMTEKVGGDIVLSIPLVTKKNLVGLVNLGRREFEAPFKQADLQFLYILAKHVAMAIQNANLHREKIEVEKLRIIEHKRAEEALRKSEERYRSVFENTGTATAIIEEDTTISMANAEFEKLSGYSKEELEGKMSWAEFVVKEDLERMKSYYAKRIEEGEELPTQYEFRFVDRKGNIKDIFLSIDMIPDTKRSVASLMDITERKQAEEDLKKKLNELEIFNDAAVGRELKMIELKKEINALLEETGNEPKYEIAE